MKGTSILNAETTATLSYSICIRTRHGAGGALCPLNLFMMPLWTNEIGGEGIMEEVCVEEKD